MREELVHRTARFACVRFLSALAVLLSGAASNAYGLDAYWKGERNADWASGINPTNGKSNWYSQQGEAREVPDGGAVFALGAARYDLRITELGATHILTMLFLKSAPQYSFDIKPYSRLVIGGGGVVNNSRRTPLFTLRRHARLKLMNAARLSSSNSGRAAQVEIAPDGETRFEGNSSGGNATINNSGVVNFLDNSSAERMIITNVADSVSFTGGKSRFLDRSTGGNARFSNGRFCVLNFKPTRGAAGDGVVTAKSINNFGELFVGTNTLVVRDDFYQEFSGGASRVHIDVRGDRAGKIHVKNAATVGGILYVESYDAQPGRYLVFHAEAGRVGEFQLQTSIPGAYLTHFPKNVYLFIPTP